MIFERIISEMNVINAYGREIIQSSNTTPVQWYTKDNKPLKPGEAGVIHLSPGVQLNDVRDEIDRISSFQAVFNPLFHADNRLTALYVTSSSGITIIFPWTPRVDATFEPRSRDWFIDALAKKISDMV
jgi:hypothetical protein